MARNPASPPVPVPEPAIDSGATAAQQAASTALVEIDKHYGGIVPYNRDRVVEETRFLLGQAAEAMLEAGRRLIQLKEHEGHGGFGAALDALNLHPKAAQRLMGAAAKLSNTPLVAHLHAPSKTKLIELATLDDGEIKELGEGGTVRGLKLDDVDRMGPTELRNAFRAHRDRSAKDKGIHERMLAQKNDKIDELTRKLAEMEATGLPELPDWPARIEETNLQVTVHAGQIAQQLDKLFSLLDRISRQSEGCGDVARRAMASHFLDALSRINEEVAILNQAATAAFGEVDQLSRIDGADYRLSEIPTVGQLVPEIGEYLAASEDDEHPLI